MIKKMLLSIHSNIENEQSVCFNRIIILLIINIVELVKKSEIDASPPQML